MKPIFRNSLIALAVLAGLAACQPSSGGQSSASGGHSASAAADKKSTISKQEAGYALGLNLHRSFADMEKQGIKPDLAEVKQGLEAYLGGQPRLSEAEAQKLMDEVQARLNPAASAPSAPLPPEQLKSFSYAVGMGIGSTLKHFEAGGLSFDRAELLKGLDDAAAGKGRLSQDQVVALLQNYSEQQQAAAIGQATVQGAKNAEAGKAFLAENGKKAGVKSTASGLQYIINKPGSGAKPSATDSVTVHYTGKLIDGTVFDSSVERGQPATFPLNGVIPGWTEGLQLMQEGGDYTFYIPAELAYGQAGSPPKIGPNSVLVFDVQLIKVNKP